MNKPNQTKINTQIQRTEQQLSEGECLGEGETGKGDQLYGDRWKPDFWW